MAVNPLWTVSFQATAFATLILAAVWVLSAFRAIVLALMSRYRIYGACVQQAARYSYVFRSDGFTLKIWVRARPSHGQLEGR